VPDPPNNPELLLRILDETRQFETERDTPSAWPHSSWWARVFNLVLSREYLDIPTPENYLAWVRGRKPAEYIPYVIQQVANLRNAVMRKLEASETGPQPRTPKASGKYARTRAPGKPPRVMKEPSAKAFATYRAVKIGGQNQKDVAERFGVNQSTVSRQVRDVAKWVEAGNVLPDEMRAEPSRGKPLAMDPGQLDKGSRLDHRAAHQRGKKDD
jgi:hypothetical protein